MVTQIFVKAISSTSTFNLTIKLGVDRDYKISYSVERR